MQRSVSEASGPLALVRISIDGVEIFVPAYHFSETHILPAKVMTPAYKTALFRFNWVSNAFLCSAASTAGEV